MAREDANSFHFIAKVNKSHINIIPIKRGIKRREKTSGKLFCLDIEGKRGEKERPKKIKGTIILIIRGIL